MPKSKIKAVIVGSINYDIASYVADFPAPGETLFADRYETAIGGKGLNQAVAAARIGADVSMIGCVGDDGFGAEACAHLKANGVDVRHVRKDESARTGFAAIMVSRASENMISVASGANLALSVQDVEAAAETIRSADILITQSEVSTDVMAAALKIASQAGVPAVLNPAPAEKSVLPLLKYVDYVTPNEHEAEALTGHNPESADGRSRVLAAFSKAGAKNVIITLGKAGVLVCKGDTSSRVDAFPVTAVDTTGAGDAFNGVFAVCIARGDSPDAAAKTAAAAAAISVTRPTADSAPSAREVKEFLAGQGA